MDNVIVMDTLSILIIGSSHLALRMKAQLVASPYHCISTDFESLSADPSRTILDKLSELISDSSGIRGVVVAEASDEHGLQILLSIISIGSTVPVYAPVFNSRLASHFKGLGEKLCVFYPPKIAAPTFVEALTKPRPPLHLPQTQIEHEKERANKLGLLPILCVLYLAFLSAAVAYFHSFEGLSWIDSIYFVTVTISTVGYGDINLLNASFLSKCYGIFLILTSMVSIWLLFSYTFESLLRRRSEQFLGHKKHRLKNHVIVCGLGRLGISIVELLLDRKENVVVIESNPNNPHLDFCRRNGVAVYVGDARFEKVLIDVNVQGAKALYSVIDSDALNIEIGLTARSLSPSLRLILRIFDGQAALQVRDKFQIHFTLSASELISAYILEEITASVRKPD